MAKEGSCFDSWQGQRIHFSTKRRDRLCGPTNHLVTGSLEKIVWGAKCATHLQLVPEVKNEWMCVSMPPMCLHGVFSGNLTFTTFWYIQTLCLPHTHTHTHTHIIYVFPIILTTCSYYFPKFCFLNRTL
jgi:hypothetical protein